MWKQALEQFHSDPAKALSTLSELLQGVSALLPVVQQNPGLAKTAVGLLPANAQAAIGPDPTAAVTLITDLVPVAQALVGAAAKNPQAVASLISLIPGAK